MVITVECAPKLQASKLLHGTVLFWGTPKSFQLSEKYQGHYRSCQGLLLDADSSGMASDPRFTCNRPVMLEKKIVCSGTVLSFTHT